MTTALVLFFASQVQAYITPNQYYDPTRHFLMNMAKTGWDLVTSDQITSLTSSNDQKLQFVARSPLTNGSVATLTMRVDNGNWTSARSYAERWLKDFPKFGYELQMSRDEKLGNMSGYDMELKGKESHRMARQFIVKQPHEMWVFTCSGDEAHFTAAWNACQKILQTAQVH